jgi:hypothetical protein
LRLFRPDPRSRDRQRYCSDRRCKGIQINIDTRLAERVLAVPELPVWLAALKLSFDDLDRCFADALLTSTGFLQWISIPHTHRLCPLRHGTRSLMLDL